MNPTPAAIDDYLLDLLAGEVVSTPRESFNTAAPAAKLETATVAAPHTPHGVVIEEPVPITTTAPLEVSAALLAGLEARLSVEEEAAPPAPEVPVIEIAELLEIADPLVAVAGSASQSTAPVRETYSLPTAAIAEVVDDTDALLTEFDAEFPAQAEPAQPAMIVPAVDNTDALLAEFDAEFPEQAEPAQPAVIAPPIDNTDALLAEFDAEFPDQIAPAQLAAMAQATDNTDALLAEFDAEFPDQVQTAPATDNSAALLAEFDAEFPQQAAEHDFATAVAEEHAADDAQHASPPASAARAAPAAFTPVMPAMPASMPAYAKPVYDLLQKQVREQAEMAQSPQGDRRRAADRASRWLRMRCDEQHYALELLKVQEVVLPATLLPLRGASPHMLGVMNLRGQVVPVIDLGTYLGREAIIGDSQTRIVVLEENGEILGLRVTAVEDVTNLSEQQIEPPDNTRMCRITHPLFRGVARLGQRTVILLDASELLK